MRFFCIMTSRGPKPSKTLSIHNLVFIVVAFSVLNLLLDILMKSDVDSFINGAFDTSQLLKDFKESTILIFSF